MTGSQWQWLVCLNGDPPLQLLLQEMLRRMIGLIIDMYVCTFDIRQALKFDLELFCYVMCSSECFIRIHNNVYFDNETRTGVVSADGINLPDIGGMRHSWES